MGKQQLRNSVIIFVLAVAIAVAVGSVTHRPTAEELAYEKWLENTPIAEVGGEACSPDGRFLVRTSGKSGLYVSGIHVPEKLEIIETATGKTVWEGDGWVRQDAAWSPDGKQLALCYGARAWEGVKIFDTDSWDFWEFKLPDGEPVPEYVYFKQENWCKWLDEDTAILSTADSISAETHTYRCTVITDRGTLTGSSLEQTSEAYPEAYDFNHDGVPELAELITIWAPEGEAAAWYELHVKTSLGQRLWYQAAGGSHAEWCSIFACRIDGQDYLLRYNPYMSTGIATFAYQIFSLDSEGNEILFRSNDVRFDNNFISPLHTFDASEIANFLEEVHGYLNDSTVLLSTEGGELQHGCSGADFEEDCFRGDGLYEGNGTLEENLRAYEEQCRIGQAATS